MLSELEKSVSNANGRRRTRTLDNDDVEKFVQLVNKNIDNPEIHTIRVYSSEGFVANSYKYRAEISYLEAHRQENGEFEVYASTCDAKRSHGNGALVTINSQATEG